MGFYKIKMISSSKWLLLHSKPNKEDFLWAEITARQMECYYPCLHVKPANPRSRKVKPYFPGYMFVHTDPASPLAAELRWLPGSAGWVHFGGELAEVPESIINGIRRQIDRINQKDPDQQAVFHPGQPVSIMEGPFSGWDGIFHSSLSGSDRVRVLLKLIHTQQKLVEMPARLLKLKNRV